MHKTINSLYPDNLNRSVAKGTRCPEAKNIFSSPLTKNAEFEVKNRYESAEKTFNKTFTVRYFCYFSK